MNSISTILFLGTRVVFASLIGLALQVLMLVKVPDQLLMIQQSMKSVASKTFELINTESQYHVSYNLIGGDNIIVHTFFVLIAYIGILLILLPFKSKSTSYKRSKRLSK